MFGFTDFHPVSRRFNSGFILRTLENPSQGCHPTVNRINTPYNWQVWGSVTSLRDIHAGRIVIFSEFVRAPLHDCIKLTYCLSISNAVRGEIDSGISDGLGAESKISSLSRWHEPSTVTVEETEDRRRSRVLTTRITFIGPFISKQQDWRWFYRNTLWRRRWGKGSRIYTFACLYHVASILWHPSTILQISPSLIRNRHQSSPKQQFTSH